MSALDKRRYAEHIVGTAEASETVRIFAFDNRRTGYKVVFSPESPLIILKTKAPAPPQHPCLQWNPFSTLLHQLHPNTTNGNLYLVDMSCLQGPEYGMGSHITGRVQGGTTVAGALEGPNTTLGPAMKKLRNAMARLNPHNGTLLAAGPSGFLGLKYALVGEKQLGHADRLVQCLVLIHPGPTPSPEMEKLMIAAATLRGSPHHGGGTSAVASSSSPTVSLPEYPKPELRVLVQNQKEAQQWCSWLHRMQDTYALLDTFHVFFSGDFTSPPPASTGKDAVGSSSSIPQPTTTTTMHRTPSALPAAFSTASLFHSVAYVCGLFSAEDGVERHSTSSGSSQRTSFPSAYHDPASFVLSDYRPVVDTIHRWTTPRVYRLDFFLSKQTKTVVQHATLSPLDTLGYDEVHAEGAERVYEQDGEHEVCLEAEEEEEEAMEVDAATAEKEKDHETSDSAAPSPSSSAAPCHCDPHHHHEEEEEEEDEEDEEEGWNFFGLLHFLHVKAPARITLEGRVMHVSKGLLSTTEGLVRVKGLKELALQDPILGKYIQQVVEEEEHQQGEEEEDEEVEKRLSSTKKAASAVNFTPLSRGARRDLPRRRSSSSIRVPGAAVRLDAVVERDEQGRTHLRAHSNLQKLTSSMEQASFTVPPMDQPEVPYQVDAIRYRAAALVIRGSKCALQRGGLEGITMKDIRHAEARVNVGEEEGERRWADESSIHISSSVEHRSTPTGTGRMTTMWAVQNTAPPPAPLLVPSSSTAASALSQTGSRFPLGVVFSLPSALVTEKEWDVMDTALQVACDAFDCSPDNFYTPHYIPPVVMYLQKTEEVTIEEAGHHAEDDGTNPSQERRTTQPTSSPLPSRSSPIIKKKSYTEVCMVYLFVTTAGPPRGAASDRVDDPFSEDNTFEWMSFRQAYHSVATAEERTALVELQQRLQQAYQVGLYQPCKGCGVWGACVGAEKE